MANNQATELKTIYLVTHAEATHSVENKVGGWYNSELTIKGKNHAALLRQQVAAAGLDLNECSAYTSDLRRAAETAEILLKNSRATLTHDRRLREMSSGNHEGMNQTEHDQIMTPASITGQRMDHKICDGAESRRDVALRMAAFMDELMSTSRDALVVTHGFAATFFFATFQQIDIESMGYIAYNLKPGSIIRLHEDNRFRNRSIQWIN